MKKWIKRRKPVCAAGAMALLLLTAAAVFLAVRHPNPDGTGQDTEKQKTENYLSLSAADREPADLYAELYEFPAEEVAEIQNRTKDWEQTGKELEEKFFTIPENTKYQMGKEGYALEDLEEAERLSAKTGRKALELAEAKGKASENRNWSEVVKDSEILTTEEQLGLTKEQIKKLEGQSLGKEERVEAAILILNGTYTFEEIMENLDNGKTIGELKK